jgi:metal-responsive CopG/Arc/MetJ family transcriptional regulator
MFSGAPAICHAAGMTVQIAVNLDDGLAEQLKAAAEDAGTNLSEWIRAALRHQALVAKAMRARAEEDTRAAPYTEAQEAALMATRRRRAIAALDEQ